jgi:hypothetical protein
MNPISINLTVSPSQIQKQGDTYSITGLPATPELEQAMKPKSVPWKPKEGGRYYYINSDGTVSTDTWEGADLLCFHRYNSGNCFPTRELAEWQAEAEQITRRLAQLCVAMGGSLVRSKTHNWYASVLGPGKNDPLVFDMPYFFVSGPQSHLFERAANTNLTRLAELNKLLTEGWVPYLLNNR